MLLVAQVTQDIACPIFKGWFKLQLSQLLLLNLTQIWDNKLCQPSTTEESVGLEPETFVIFVIFVSRSFLKSKTSVGKKTVVILCGKRTTTSAKLSLDTFVSRLRLHKTVGFNIMRCGPSTAIYRKK